MSARERTGLLKGVAAVTVMSVMSVSYFLTWPLYSLNRPNAASSFQKLSYREHYFFARFNSAVYPLGWI